MTITWDDIAGNSIKNQWLQVTVKAGGNTGLAAADVFYFGNAIGESGNNPANAVVDSADESGSRTHKTGFTAAAIDNPYDYNRDGKVNATDDLIARNNTSAELQLISAPVGGCAGGHGSLAAGGIFNDLSARAGDGRKRNLTTGIGCDKYHIVTSCIGNGIRYKFSAGTIVDRGLVRSAASADGEFGPWRSGGPIDH